MKKWLTLDSKRAFDHRWFKVQQDTVELTNGKVLDDYLYYLHGDVATVIAFTPKNEIVMVRQYRHAIGEVFLELPSGIVDDGEDPKAAAIRELAEETGYTGENFELLTALCPSPGKIRGKWYTYLLTNATPTAQTHFDPSEELELELVPAAKVLQMIRAGELTADTTISPVYMALDKLGLLKDLCG